jgi:protein-S-isoprenylcysteine O-methyltransferase Ste14
MSMPPEYYDGISIVLLVAGCRREIGGIRRRHGSRSAHLLRMVGWLTVCVLFILIANTDMGSRAEPAHWLLALQLVLLVGALVLLLATGRAAGYTKRKEDDFASGGRHRA